MTFAERGKQEDMSRLLRLQSKKMSRTIHSLMRIRSEMFKRSWERRGKLDELIKRRSLG